MNRKIIIVLALLILALLVIVVSGNKSFKESLPIKTENPNQQLQSTKTLKDLTNQIKTVKLTDSGFVPPIIKIKRMTRVIWQNKSGKIATVNSDDHPTHVLYMPLNLGQFENGSTVQLVFEDAGAYKYHNHLNPKQIGTVVVE